MLLQHLPIPTPRMLRPASSMTLFWATPSSTAPPVNTRLATTVTAFLPILSFSGPPTRANMAANRMVALTTSSSQTESSSNSGCRSSIAPDTTPVSYPNKKPPIAAKKDRVYTNWGVLWACPGVSLFCTLEDHLRFGSGTNGRFSVMLSVSNSISSLSVSVDIDNTSPMITTDKCHYKTLLSCDFLRRKIYFQFHFDLLILKWIVFGTPEFSELKEWYSLQNCCILGDVIVQFPKSACLYVENSENPE